MTNWKCWPQLFGWQANYIHMWFIWMSVWIMSSNVVVCHNQMYENIVYTIHKPISYGHWVTDEPFSATLNADLHTWNWALWLLFIHIEWWNMERWMLNVKCKIMDSSLSISMIRWIFLGELITLILFIRPWNYHLLQSKKKKMNSFLYNSANSKRWYTLLQAWCLGTRYKC